MSTPTRAPERIARAALAAFHAPAELTADLVEYGAVDLWDRLSRTDTTGRLARYDARGSLLSALDVAAFVFPGDDDWPAALDGIGPAAPLGLWMRGTGSLRQLSARAVAVTGNRHATRTGQQTAAHLAGNLAEAGHTVTASLAYGIDVAGHLAAQLTPAPTLAVLPCGLDLPHPHTHGDLARTVSGAGGAVVSAFRPCTAASRATLKVTAELTAALTRAVLLVEAMTRTPAMETANAAIALHRPVFALAPPDDDSADRTHPMRGNALLLARGQARPVTRAAEVTAALTAQPAESPVTVAQALTVVADLMDIDANRHIPLRAMVDDLVRTAVFGSFHGSAFGHEWARLARTEGRAAAEAWSASLRDRCAEVIALLRPYYDAALTSDAVRALAKRHTAA
ncbi:DNA-processing protein DprA [Streptomyces sp. NPDC088354]|uniref:DNA-processing protein DprA n=1 Tax=Streptomyces sp. NPDC088354 TaxID=3365856 RepID=UPI00380850A8